MFVFSDSIEDYIQTASSNVETANQELAKANRYQVQGTSCTTLFSVLCIHFVLFYFCVVELLHCNAFARSLGLISHANRDFGN